LFRAIVGLIISFLEGVIDRVRMQSSRREEEWKGGRDVGEEEGERRNTTLADGLLPIKHKGCGGEGSGGKGEEDD
jgi:hypothetical protein